MPSSSYYHNTKRDASPSKRWQTTTRSALEEVAGHLQGNYDRNAMVTGLKDRKIANTKTSISFGTDKVSYISDTMDNQLKCSGSVTPEERAVQQERIRAMKADLTTTNFRLGDEKPKYLSVNHESMAIAETFHTAANSATMRASQASSNGVKEAVKKSSIHLGNDRVQYLSATHDAMAYRGSGVDFSQRKEEVQDMTKALRKHNFSFGDEKVDYTTDYTRGYASVPMSAYRTAGTNQGHMKATIEDQRSAHFTLGHDKPHYVSHTHEALKSVDTQNAAQDVAQQMQRARDMKSALVKTSIVIGDDVDYT